jgi:pimeloyl-ACP methyl ester carboxylesterase
MMAGAEKTAQRWPDDYFKVSDGTRLHYVEAGEGWPVILIHGARGSAIGNWFSNGIAPKLAETNKVYALDMRGHGLSEGNHQHMPFNHSVMPNDVLDFMNHMGIEKAHMAGYSMGSHVLTQLLTMAPERFLTVCFQGGGVNETPEWRDRVPPDKEGRDPDQAKADELVKQRRQQKGEEVGNNFSDGQRRQNAKAEEAKPEGAVNKWRQRMMERRARRMGFEGPLPPPEMMNVFQKREEQLAKFDLTSIAFPVMAINGEYDRPLAKTHRLWRECRNFTNLILPGKGHLTAMMAGFIPDAYVEGYAAFVRRNNPPGAPPARHFSSDK